MKDETYRHLPVIPPNKVISFGPNAWNKGGGLGFQDTPEMALYRQAATSLWSGDGYYERKEEWLARLRENIDRVMRREPRFPFALAAYTRDKSGLGLRTSALILYLEASMHPAAKGSGLVRSYAAKVLRRADEPARALAYLNRHYGGNPPHGLLRGIADLLPGFDAYELAKYRQTTPVSLRDVLRVARPRPADTQQGKLWAQVVSGTLPAPYTWEVELSQCSSDEEKRVKWNELLASGRLGIFALVRNLRNILSVEADVEEALSQITPERAKGAGILPFQWFRAYQEVLIKAGVVIAAPLQEAVRWSLDELPRWKGITLVACDNSGSMTSSAPSRGMTFAEIGNLMGAMALYCSESGAAGTFGDNFELTDTDAEVGLFANKQRIDECGKLTGHSTEAWRIFEYLIQHRIYVDRVIIFSDMQCYDLEARHGYGWVASRSLSAELDAYRKLNPNVVVYSINLASQDNTTQFAPDQPVIELAGWSENIFGFITALESGQSILDVIRERY